MINTPYVEKKRNVIYVNLVDLYMSTSFDIYIWHGSIQVSTYPFSHLNQPTLINTLSNSLLPHQKEKKLQAQALSSFLRATSVRSFCQADLPSTSTVKPTQSTKFTKNSFQLILEIFFNELIFPRGVEKLMMSGAQKIKTTKK